MAEMKSFKLNLPYVSLDGTISIVEQTVSFKSVIEKDNDIGLYSGLRGKLITYSMGMSIVLPDHVHSKLKGQYIGRKSSNREYAQYDVTLKKTLTCESLQLLTERYREVLLDYKWLIDLEQMSLTKVIFYKFDGDTNEATKSSWNGIKIGSYLNIKYGYFIGYISEDGKSRFNEDKKSFHKSYDSELFSNWGYVSYSEERDVFFSTIFNKFKSIIKELKGFDKSITEKSIDDIISSKPKLLS